MLTDLLLTGILKISGQKFLPQRKRLYTLLLGFAIFLPLSGFVLLWVATYPNPVRGAWVDQAVSRILTQRYGEEVQVKNCSVVRWFSLSFTDLVVRSKDHKPLIEAQKGRIQLKKIRPRKFRLRLETEILLENASFHKDYYKNFPELKWFLPLMQKPIHMDSLTLTVKQDPRKTWLDITHCRSRDILLEGSILVENAKILKQNLTISFSPLMMFHSIF